MAVVRVQAKSPEGEWQTLAQLEQSEAQDYIDSLRSEHFLAAVEEQARRALEKAGETNPEALKNVKATHLRSIREDPAAFRIIPHWELNDSIAQDHKRHKDLGVSPT